MAEFKKLEMLTMKDNFMFGAVMSEPENCRPFLEMALGFPIGKLTVNRKKSYCLGQAEAYAAEAVRK